MSSEDCIDGMEEFARPYDEMTVADLFESGKQVKFLYDFGDGWERLNEREIKSGLAFSRQHGIFPWFADDEEDDKFSASFKPYTFS